MDKREKLISYAVAHNGNWASIARAINRHEIASKPADEEKCITIYDSAYPEALRRLRYPPWVLFYQGDIGLLENRMITVVGSRNATDYGLMATEWIVENLCSEYTVVSGLAKGIDTCAHQTCMNLGGKTIGVIGCGLNTHYPRSSHPLYEKMKEKHLILSEYPAHTGVRKEHFPWRNRILAALGNPVFVTQAGLKSGTMLTVNEAIQLSRDIYCIPYPIGNEQGCGCNALIEQGANILYRQEQLDDLIRVHVQKQTLKF